MFLPGEGDQDCKLFAGEIGVGNEWELLDKDDIETGVKITLTHGSQFEDQEGQYYHTTFELYCNSSVDDLEFYDDDQKFDLTQQNNTLRFRSSKSCAQVNFYQIWKFINDKKAIFASVLIAVGLFEAIFGYWLRKPTTFIVCMAIVVVFCFIFFFQLIIPSGTNEAVIWVVLAVGLVVGGILGYFACKYNRIVLGVIIGALCGYFVGGLIYVSFLAHIKKNATVILVFSYLIPIGILVALSIFFCRAIIIGGTAFLGAYAFIRGISIFAGGYPSEGTLIDLIKEKEFETLKKLLTWRVYIYFVFILIAFGLSLFVQIKYMPKNEDDEKEDGGNKNGDGLLDVDESDNGKINDTSSWRSRKKKNYGETDDGDY